MSITVGAVIVFRGNIVAIQRAPLADNVFIIIKDVRFLYSASVHFINVNNCFELTVYTSIKCNK